MVEEMIRRLEQIDLPVREDLIGSIKKLESEVWVVLSEENRQKWKPGKGFAVSKALSLWKDAVIRKLLKYCGGIPSGLAVIAVGGYGRAELSPYSDMDMLILSRKNINEQETVFIRNFLTMLWDIGYKLGNSVRTLKNIDEDAREDIQFLTALFAVRLIEGDTELFSLIKGSVSKVLSKMRLKYLKEKSNEIIQTIRNTGSEILVKEPNLKSSSGGLRSVHLKQWLNYAFYERSGFQGLSEFFNKYEYKKLYQAYDFILYIRNYLHFRTGRKEDILRIEYQSEAAALFGYSSNGREGMSRLMKKYYERALFIMDMLLRISDQFIINFEKPKWKVLEEGKYKVFGELFFPDENAPVNPAEGLKALIFCIKGNYRYSEGMIRYLHACLSGMDQTALEDRNLFLLMREILSLPEAYEALMALSLSGFLYRYIFPLRAVKNQIVYNPFHQYPIDHHSLEAVRALDHLVNGRKIGSEKIKKDHLVRLVKKYADSLWLVRLALILHDTGKAYPGDHAKNSAEIARMFLKPLPTESLIKDMIVFLAENHLLLANIVRRNGVESSNAVRDLSREFIASPYPEEYLEFLYLVTYADISATNGKNFSAYTAGQLEKLYLETIKQIRKNGKEDDKSLVLQKIIFDLLSGQDDPEFKDFAESMGERYLLSNQPEEIKDDFRLYQESAVSGNRIKVTLFNDHLKVKVWTQDKKGLFSILSGILLLNGADIVRADIHTYKEIAFDEFIITSVYGNDVLENQMNRELEVWIEDLTRSLSYYLDHPSELHEKIEVHKSNFKKLPEVFRREPKVMIRPKGNGLVEIEVSCTDRPALLYDMTHFLASAGLEVQSSYIDTSGWYVHDLFEAFMGDENNMEKLRQLHLELHRLVDFPV